MFPNRPTGFTAVIALAALAAIASSTHAEVHATKEFTEGTTRPVTIALLPPRVELVRQKLVRTENEVDESGELEGHLVAAVAAELRARGYEVSIVDADYVAAEPGLQELVVDADRRFSEMLTNLGSRLSKRVDDRRYNAGDEMRLLASRLGVDAVGYTRMQIVVQAAGVRALNMGMGGPQTMMSVTLIDGQSSDIEAFITLPILRRGKMFGGYEDIMSDPDVEMANYARATLDDLPAADPSLRADRSDEDLFAEIESLLDE